MPCGSSSRAQRAAPSTCITSKRIFMHGPRGRPDQHGVTVAEETVTILHCVPVSGERRLEACVSRHQHQQSRSRQVKISHQRIDHAKAKPRSNEQRRVAAARTQPIDGGRLERSRHGRTDGNDPPASRASPIDRLHGGRRNLETLRVHDVFLDCLSAERLKCARTHVQSNHSPLDSACGKRIKQRGVKMQTGRGCRHGAGNAREQTLVAFAVLCIRGARDVRGKRHAPEALEEFDRRFRKLNFPQVLLPPYQPQRTSGAGQLLSGHAADCWHASAPAHRANSGASREATPRARRRLALPPGAPAAPAYH